VAIFAAVSFSLAAKMAALQFLAGVGHGRERQLGAVQAA